MLFLGLEDVLEQLPRNEVPALFAIRDGGQQVPVRRLLELQVAGQAFLQVLADEQLGDCA